MRTDIGPKQYPQSVRNAYCNERKIQRLTRNGFLEAGDVIGVARNKALNLY